ncbi:heterokaryon incompatibility protein-domain-containing protein, partial [Aspergillus crustosus]
HSAFELLPINSNLCATCQSVDFGSLLHDGETSLHRFEHNTVYLGTLEIIWHQALDGCPFCADILLPIIAEVSRESSSNPTSAVSAPSDSVFVCLVVQNSRFSYPSVAVSHRSKEFYVGIDIRYNRESPPLFASSLGTLVRGNYDHFLVTGEQPVCLLDHELSAYRTLKPRVDRELCRSWFDTCCGQHETCRQNISSTMSPPSTPTERDGNRFFKLINVRTRQVVTMGNRAVHQYATLSYVCGEAYTLCILSESEDWMQDGEGNWVHPLPIELPNTLEDALIVTANLGLRYLWVDSICIAQDNEEEKQAQILAMHDIYANSEICIVAASGDNSRHGLPGLRTTRNLPGSASGVPLRAGGSALVGPLQPALSDILQRYRWLRRAWTLQEILLARRCLIFTETETFFTCSKVALRESLIGAYEVSDIFDHFTYMSSGLSAMPLTSKRVNSGEAIWMYEKVFEEYTRRELTYQSDGINAFRGVETLIAKRLDCEMISGCPVPLLGYCLNWRLQTRICAKDKWPARRMLRDKENEKDNKHLVPLLPSWAWAAWKGAFSFHYEYDHAGTVLKVLHPAAFSPIPASESTSRYKFALTRTIRGQQGEFLLDTLPIFSRVSKGHFSITASTEALNPGFESEDTTSDPESVIISTPNGTQVGSCDVRGMLNSRLTSSLQQNIAILQLGAGILPQGAPKYCRILLLQLHDLLDSQPALAQRLVVEAASSTVVKSITRQPASMEKDRWFEPAMPEEELCHLRVPESVPESIVSPLLATRLGIGQIDKDAWIEGCPETSLVFLA